MVSGTAKGHWAAIGMMVIFGVDAPVMKSVMPHWIDAYGLVTFRMCVAAAFAWLLSIWGPREQVSPSDRKWLLFAGLFGILLNQGGITIGVQYSNPIDVGIIVTMAPIIVLLIAFFFKHEPLHWRKWAGTFLGLSGALLITLSGGGTGHKGTMLGDLIVLMGITSYAVYLVYARGVMGRYHILTLMRWIFTTAALCSLPVGGKALLDSPVAALDAPWTVYARMLFSSLGATFAAFMLNMLAMKRISGHQIAMYGYLQPLISTIIALMLGQGMLTWQDVLAAVLISWGVFWATLSEGTKKA